MSSGRNFLRKLNFSKTYVGKIIEKSNFPVPKKKKKNTMWQWLN